MNVYMTEEEQVEAIKKWWMKYGNQLMWGAAIVLAIYSGFQWFSYRENKIKTSASVSFQQLMFADKDQDPSIREAKLADIKANFSKTVYADAADLLKVPTLINNNQLGQAKTLLKDLLAKKPNEMITMVAKLRLARVYYAEKEMSEALALIASLESTPYAKEALELKGDIFGFQGKKQMAKDAYQKAITLAGNKGETAYLQYKMDNA